MTIEEAQQLVEVWNAKHPVEYCACGNEGDGSPVRATAATTATPAITSTIGTKAATPSESAPPAASTTSATTPAPAPLPGPGTSPAATQATDPVTAAAPTRTAPPDPQAAAVLGRRFWELLAEANRQQTDLTVALTETLARLNTACKR